MSYINYISPKENKKIQFVLYNDNNTNQYNFQDEYINFNDVQDHFGLPKYQASDFSFSYFGAPRHDIISNFNLQDYMPLNNQPAQQTQQAAQQSPQQNTLSLGQQNLSSVPSDGTSLALPGLMEAINKNIGKPYVWGGHNHNPRGVDCIGFVNDVLDDMGYKIYSSANTYLNKMTDKFYDPKLAKKGDLLFWTFKANSNQRFNNGQYRPHGTPSHIAIVLETRGPYVKVAESAGSGGGAVHWVKMFDGNEAAPGKIYANYAPSNKNTKYEFLAFGRLNKNKVEEYKRNRRKK